MTEQSAELIKYAAVIIKDGKWLVCRDANQDFWKNVGGLPEGGESPEDCLAREVAEELGVKVKSIQYYFSTPISMTVTEPKKSLIIHMYKIDIDGKPSPSSEVGELHWLSRKDFESGKYNLAIQITEFIAPRLIKDGLIS